MSVRSLALFAACILPTLAACGGTTQPTQDRPGKPGPTANEAPTLLSATSGSSLYVVAARASSGSVVPFGPALPADSSRYDVTQLTVSADNSRAALVLRPKVGTTNATSESDTLVVGDGQRWTSLLEGPAFSISFQASKDLGLFAATTTCPGSPNGATRPVIVRADGTRVFDDGDCNAGHFVYAFSPDDSYFVLQDRTTALTLYPAQSGAAGAGVPVSPGGIVGSAFETSLIVFDTQGDPNLGRWIDTSGAALSVAGYAPYTGTPAGLVDIQGNLYALADRKVSAVQTVPSGAPPEDIAAVVGDGLVLLKAEQASTARLVDAAGHGVGSYAPDAPLAPSPPPGLHVTSSIGARRLTTSGAWVVIQNVYETTPTDGSSGFQTYELSEDLWLLTDGAGKPASKKLSIRHIPTDQAIARERTYVPSSDGKSVFYVESATIHAIDVASGDDHAFASDFQAGDLASRCDLACVVF